LKGNIEMSPVEEAMHNHHQEMVATLGKHTADLLEKPAEADPAALVDFLNNELMPHATGEEKYLYPVVDSLIKTHGSATATMSIDHEFIENYVREIEKTTAALKTAANGNQAALMERLQQLTLQLQGIFLLHLEKEERIYLPLFEQYTASEEQERILNNMHESGSEQPIIKTTIDVRQIPPPQRHPLIFQTFEALEPGEFFRLVNDHDPKPLHYQFKFEHEGQFTWEYVESGPQVWQVNIGKTAAK
jgi:uncharacterized protein (DUF2249 family)